MKATTIKLEGDLLRELEAVRPASQSLSRFVREVLRQDLKRRRLARSAVQYEAFLRSHPQEREWLADWEKADLARPPRRRRSRRS